MKRNLFVLLFILLATGSYSQSGIKNPVLDRDFPDPTVISCKGKFYAYATNTDIDGNIIHIQVASSSDLQNWKIEGDALPQRPNWANKDFWAPHVLYDSRLKKFVLFYSGESTDEKTGKCLGVAFADKPEGPFVDKGTPLICGESFINIDPMAYVDPASGKNLLYWGSAHEPIRVQEMANDWSSFKEGTTQQPVIWPSRERIYERLVEGPWVDYHKGYYYLYYSGDNCCGEQANYAVMVARAKSPLGPFEKQGGNGGKKSNAVVEKNEEWLAPGHNSIFRNKKGNVYIAYHAIPLDKVNKQRKNDKRVFCIDRIQYKDGWPVLVRDQAN